MGAEQGENHSQKLLAYSLISHLHVTWPPLATRECARVILLGILPLSNKTGSVYEEETGWILGRQISVSVCHMVLLLS